MPKRKRTAPASEGLATLNSAKRRSTRQAAQRHDDAVPKYKEPSTEPESKPGRKVAKPAASSRRTTVQGTKKAAATAPKVKDQEAKPTSRKVTGAKRKDPVDAAVKPPATKSAKRKTKPTAQKEGDATKPSERAISEDPDVDDIPAENPEVIRHDGEWYWLLKAEPESRLENDIDVKFSIDDLRAKTKPEPWDGIRAYPARNNLRSMNVHDKGFFYHSNCKEPGIVGIMEIVKEYSEDRGARKAGTPYYDPTATKEKNRWSVVHVKFLKKFAVPIYLKEMRELAQPGQPLDAMQMLKQSRLSVSKVSQAEWKFLCQLADEKAQEAGLDHESA